MDNAKQPSVYIGDSPGTVEIVSNVYCDMVSLKNAPDMSQTVLTYNYGKIKPADSSEFQILETLDFRGKHVKIVLDEVVIFSGVIGSQGDEPGGTFEFAEITRPSGETKYHAFDYIFLLDRIYVDCSYLLERFTYRNFAFNGDSGTLTKNRSSEKVLGAYYFDFSTDPQLWTALDIVEYLLAYFADMSGFVWEITGCSEYLAGYTPQLDPDGKTVRQCLNEIIKPEFGFTYIVDVVNGEESTTMQLRIISISDENISYNDSVIIPANPNILQLEETISYSKYVNNVQINQVEESTYSKIRVYSEPVRMMASYYLGSDCNALNKAWSDSLEAEYIAADDESRKKDRFDPVYCKFKLTDNWDRLDYSDNEVNPEIDYDDCSLHFLPDNVYVANAYAFDRTLPIKVEPDNPKSEFRKPLLFLEDEEGNYFLADKQKNTDKPNIGFTVFDDVQGIQINAPYPHILGKDHFDGTSDYSAEYDYTHAIVTLSFYTDAVIAYIVDGAEVSGVNRTKSIYVPGYHVWLGAPETMIDVNETLPEDEYTYYRDDREALKKIAYLAKSWYGRKRNTLSFSISGIGAIGSLGKIVGSIYSGGSFEPIGTLITSIEYDFQQQTMIISTDFEDINIVSISGRYLRNSAKATAKRLSKIEDSIRNIPVRNGGSLGGGSTTLVKLKATTDDYQTYTADRYENGINKPATKTDIPVKIRTISESEVIPFLNTEWAFYEARQELWPVTVDEETTYQYFWTCQPPIIPGELET